MSDLASLIKKAINLKEGNREVALFYDPDSWKRVTGGCWSFHLGTVYRNPGLGEAPGEFEGEGETPEEAVQDVIRQLETAR